MYLEIISDSDDGTFKYLCCFQNQSKKFVSILDSSRFLCCIQPLLVSPTFESNQILELAFTLKNLETRCDYWEKTLFSYPVMHQYLRWCKQMKQLLTSLKIYFKLTTLNSMHLVSDLCKKLECKQCTHLMQDSERCLVHPSSALRVFHILHCASVLLACLPLAKFNPFTPVPANDCYGFYSV